MSKIRRPCPHCMYENSCEYNRGCYAWKAWFRAYWKALRAAHRH